MPPACSLERVSDHRAKGAPRKAESVQKLSFRVKGESLGRLRGLAVSGERGEKIAGHREEAARDFQTALGASSHCQGRIIAEAPTELGTVGVHISFICQSCSGCNGGFNRSQ